MLAYSRQSPCCLPPCTRSGTFDAIGSALVKLTTDTVVTLDSHLGTTITTTGVTGTSADVTLSVGSTDVDGGDLIMAGGGTSGDTSSAGNIRIKGGQGGTSSGVGGAVSLTAGAGTKTGPATGTGGNFLIVAGAGGTTHGAVAFYGGITGGIDSHRLRVPCCACVELCGLVWFCVGLGLVGAG